MVLDRPPSNEHADIIMTTLMCKELNCLPGAGGLLDQHPLIVDLLNVTISAINERSELEQKRAKAKQQ